MSSPSNLYAEKIFSEHPTVLWSLDDKADYISLISEEDRDLTTWTVTNATASSFTSVSDEPFTNSAVTKLIGVVPSPGEESKTIVCKSDLSSDVFFTDLNQSLSTFTVGAYVYSLSEYISSIEIGYSYIDPLSADEIEVTKLFNIAIPNKWLFVSQTFNIPNKNTNLQLVLKITYINASTSSDDYHFLVNGVTLGQWSEEFNSSSLGVEKITLPSNINISATEGIAAAAYGLQQNQGYYLIKDSALVAKNSGVPMVYGSEGVTSLSPNDEGLPSLIVPGKGFLNSLGKNKEYTLEFWLRANGNTSTYKKIFGPISSTDGLYINGPFISLKVGDNLGSHYVGEWFRPMIVHIRYIKNNVSLLINGEEVISLDLLTDSLSFPNPETSNKSNDWLGFYAYEDISPMEIDCVAIYEYQVPAVVAKRRWVYGQGVEFPEGINQAYSGTSVFIDYPFADYTNNYLYPDIGRWNQGIVDNLTISNNILSTPSYSLPEIFLSDNRLQDLYDDCKVKSDAEGNLLFSFKPDSSWSSNSGYLLFNNFNILTEEVKAFYGVFKELAHSSDEILFHVKDRLTSDSFSIILKTDAIEYVLNYNGTSEVIYSTNKYVVGEIFSVGLNIQKFSDNFGGNVSSFFGRKGFLSLYVGGNQDLENTFSGNIYKVGFSNERNLSTIAELFDVTGLVDDYIEFTELPAGTNMDAGVNGYAIQENEWTKVYDGGQPVFFKIVDGETIYEHVPASILLEYTASYTLSPSVYFDNLTLDIDVRSYWEDYIPLTYFAQYVNNDLGNPYYDLDFLQLNINYPAPESFIRIESEPQSWTYAQLYNEYSNPIQRDYSFLDNSLFTGYDNYQDLAERTQITDYKYDTSKSLVKSHISFQYIATGANASPSFFTYKQLAPKNGVIFPDNDWINTKYEFVDGMIAYPPSTTDFNNLALVLHLDFEVKGILQNKINLRSLEIASQAFNHNSFNPVGTRFGTDMYPYRKAGIYYDYKSPNPFSIYKKSSPYLYLTKNSGIEIRGDYDPLINRGISVPINPTKSDDYQIMAVQACIRYDKDFFPFTPVQIFEIQSQEELVKFYVQSIHPDGKRARIYAVNANTGEIEDGIAFYLNGKLVVDPVITVREWAFLGISFANLLEFNNYIGAFRVNGPITFNNISYYKSTILKEVKNIVRRPWFKVKNAGLSILDWLFWKSAYRWQGVLVISSTSLYGADPSDIYKSYIGTNKIIVDDPTTFRLNNYQYSVYSDILWQQQTLDAV